MYIGPRRAILILVGLGLLGFLFAWSGLFNVAASSGHWAITNWALHYAMRQSVETHSMGVEAPGLDDPAMVLRGAGHFASGCAPCHGAPGQPQNPIVMRITPPPPRLDTKIGEWTPEELFWIVRHGVKFTAMPAWPAQARSDEVWAMVAFLLKLPGLDPAQYRRLALGPMAEALAPAATGAARLAGLGEPLEQVLGECARCHGRDGQGRGVGAFPVLTGQSEAYLLAALEAFADGRRHSGIMQPQAAALDPATMRALAAHYAGATAALPEWPAPPAELVAAGRKLAREGSPRDGVPPCAACHGPSAHERLPYYPVLAGQPRSYLQDQLHLWREGVRGGSPFSPIMHAVADGLSDDQIRAAAAFYASLDPHEPEGRP